MAGTSPAMTPEKRFKYDRSALWLAAAPSPAGGAAFYFGKNLHLRLGSVADRRWRPAFHSATPHANTGWVALATRGSASFPPSPKTALLHEFPPRHFEQARLGVAVCGDVRIGSICRGDGPARASGILPQCVRD